MSNNVIPNIGYDLLRIHKVISRALDVALRSIQDNKQSERYPKGFMMYLRSLTIVLHGHHEGEDELSFPFWRTRLPEGPFDKLSEQHRQMLFPIEKVERWIEAVIGSPTAGLIAEVRQPLADLLTLWLAHIELEEATIGPENTAKYLTQDENALLGKQLAEHGQAHAKPPEIAIPFVVYNLAGVDRVEYLKLLPPMLSQKLIPNVWKAAWAPMIPFLLNE
jgi:hypothetical protein